jgi:hypothetical protein
MFSYQPNHAIVNCLRCVSTDIHSAVMSIDAAPEVFYKTPFLVTVVICSTAISTSNDTLEPLMSSTH